MGRKGVSKRKPKKEKPFSKPGGNRNSSNARSGEQGQAQSLAKENRAPFDSGGVNSSSGSNKKNNKGK